MRTHLAIGLAVAGIFAGLQTSLAQDSVLAEMYGYGVHSFFAGDYEEAHEYLTTAVDQGSRDPRVYFFRGLTYTRLGRPDEAKMDYEKGAELETSGADRVYPVGRSLQRVQGSLRLQVEKHRRVARLVALKRDLKAKAARYEQLKNAEGEVLRNPNRPEPTAAENLVGPPPATDETDPFGAGATAAEPEVAATPAAPAAATEPAADTTGGETPAPATPMDDSDPFGEDAGDTSDPFGTDPAPTNDEATDPFADDAPAMEDDGGGGDPFADPFGN